MDVPAEARICGNPSTEIGEWAVELWQLDFKNWYYLYSFASFERAIKESKWWDSCGWIIRIRNKVTGDILPAAIL